MPAVGYFKAGGSALVVLICEKWLILAELNVIHVLLIAVKTQLSAKKSAI